MKKEISALVLNIQQCQILEKYLLLYPEIKKGFGKEIIKASKIDFVSEAKRITTLSNQRGAITAFILNSMHWLYILNYNAIVEDESNEMKKIIATIREVHFFNEFLTDVEENNVDIEALIITTTQKNIKYKSNEKGGRRKHNISFFLLEAIKHIKKYTDTILFVSPFENSNEIYQKESLKSFEYVKLRNFLVSSIWELFTSELTLKEKRDDNYYIRCGLNKKERISLIFEMCKVCDVRFFEKKSKKQLDYVYSEKEIKHQIQNLKK